MKITKIAIALSMALVINTTAVAHNKKVELSMDVIGTYKTGVFDEGAAEIVAHDAHNQRVFVINANAATVDVLDINDPTNPMLMGTIDATSIGKVANSVAVHKGLVAVAIEADDKQAPGKVAFYNHGAMHATVRTASFEKFNGMEDELREKGIRIFGPGASAAQDFEPEYITVSRNSRKAWVGIQEANAMAVINIRKAEVTDILPFGTRVCTCRILSLVISTKVVHTL